MKVLKLYAWEVPFLKRITEVRGVEIFTLQLSAKLWSLLNFTFTCRWEKLHFYLKIENLVS